MPRKKDLGTEWLKLLWPGFFPAEAGAFFARGMMEALSPQPEPKPQPEVVWATPNEIVLQLDTARLRRFGPAPKRQGPKERRPILVCAPFALHDARIADLCEGHSLVASLRTGGGPVYLVEWLSAGETQAFRHIDDYLSDLNVMVDEIGTRCDFVGMCQGGWLSLIYAARFPAKAGKLVVAAAPVDTHVVDSPLSSLARSAPIETFQELVRLGEGLARGGQAQQFWGLMADSPEQIHDLLQSDLPLDSERFAAQAILFQAWSESPLDLPGAYYLEVVEKLYKENQLARGEFVALGKRIDLHDIRRPLFLIAARDDEVAAPEQTLACARMVGTPPRAIREAVVPGGHLHLFLGSRALKSLWPDVVAWLGAP
jgi:poly(3-hydroxyalkanoate) synthetase